MATNPATSTPTASKEEEERFRVSQLMLKNTSIANQLGTSTGHLDVEKAVDALLETRESNKFLTKVIIGLVVYSFLLTATIFGVSIAAAEIAKDTKIDPSTGFVYAKHGQDSPIMRTAEAIVSNKPNSIHGLTTGDLADLLTVAFQDGSIMFHVKGFSSTEEKTMLLVEGGALTFNDTGLVDVIGDSVSLIFDAFSVDEGRRQLAKGALGEGETFTATTTSKLLQNFKPPKSLVCDYCESDANCESGECNKSRRACYGTLGKMPTFCPSNSRKGGLALGRCANANECESDRCVIRLFLSVSFGSCHNRKPNGEGCSENSDCKSNTCDQICLLEKA